MPALPWNINVDLTNPHFQLVQCPVIRLFSDMDKSSHNTPNPTRRHFIKSVGFGAASTAFSVPNILRSQEASKAVTVGEGEHTYECIHDWGQLPDGHSYGGASHGIAIDSQGLVYVTHHGNPGSIFVFDPDGKFIRTMGDVHTFRGDGFGHGIDIRKEADGEYLYLSSDADPNARVLGVAKMTLDGTTVWQAGVPFECGKYDAKNPRFRPTNISFHPDGGFYVGDGYGSNFIHHYDKDGKYLSTFGATGNDKGQFNTPHGQWLDERDGTPKIAICDRANARIQYMSLEGEHLSFIEGLLFPADIDIRGEIMLVPDLHARITLFDKDNKVITQLGDDENWRKQVLDGFKMRGQRNTWKPGKFIHPHDACFDKDGNIFVAEWVVGGRVSKLRKV